MNREVQKKPIHSSEMVHQVTRSIRHSKVLLYTVLLLLSSVGIFCILFIYPLEARGLVKNVNALYAVIEREIPTKSKGTVKSLTFSEGKNMSLFTEVITGEDMEIQLAVIDAFHEAMSRNAIPYFMYGGTLIGSWRHHGFIPWDDDMDVAVPSDQRELVYKVLSVLKPQFLLFYSLRARWKFYSNRSHPIEQRAFRWPYIDISFYLSNETRVWDVNTGPNSKFSYLVEIVFPLQPRPFMNRLLPAPFNTEEVLTASYNIRMCQIGPYDHMKEKHKTLKGLVTNVPCKELENMFPFVQRVRLKTRHGCNETLVQNGSTVIKWFYRDFGSC